MTKIWLFPLFILFSLELHFGLLSCCRTYRHFRDKFWSRSANVISEGMQTLGTFDTIVLYKNIESIYGCMVISLDASPVTYRKCFPLHEECVSSGFWQIARASWWGQGSFQPAKSLKNKTRKQKRKLVKMIPFSYWTLKWNQACKPLYWKAIFRKQTGQDGEFSTTASSSLMKNGEGGTWVCTSLPPLAEQIE